MGLNLLPKKVIAAVTLYAEEMSELWIKQGRMQLVDESPRSGIHSYLGCHLTLA